MIRRIFVFLMMCGAFLGIQFSLRAQDAIVLSVALPPWVKSSITDRVLRQFEEEHQSVDVVIVDQPQSGPTNFKDTLNETKTLASSADVIYVDNYTIRPEITRTGYYLDLEPLVGVDTTINPSDYQPSMWRSFQWEQGMWALPISASSYILIYDRDAFDALGLSYPTEDWSFDDFEFAVRTLAKYEPNGQVSSPGFVGFDDYSMLRIFYGGGLYDNTRSDEPPLLTTQAFIELVERWGSFFKDGVIGSNGQNGFTTQNVPFALERTLIAYSPQTTRNLGGSLLPGGRALLQVNGLAVSSGTAYPELSYTLAKYLTQQPEVANASFTEAPAYSPLEDTINLTGQYRPQTDEMRGLVHSAIENGLSGGDLRYLNYLNNVIYAILQNPQDTGVTLQETEREIQADLQAAEARRNDTIVVTEPPLPKILEGNKIRLTLGVQGLSPVYDEQVWQRFLDTFVSNDPQVGDIKFDNVNYPSLRDYLENTDCFYLNYNGSNYLNNSVVADLTPLLGIDATFSPSDFLPGTLEQAQSDGKILGLPLTINPEVLWYDHQVFESLGIPLPEDGWSVFEFSDALNRISVKNEVSPLIPESRTGTYLLLLIAGYGGLPLDFRSSPATLNFTDPVTIDAVRQVLDLARNNFIIYRELDNPGAAGTPVTTIGALYTDMYNVSGFRAPISSGIANFTSQFNLVTYPRGNQYTPVAYTIGTAHININTPYKEACYRLLIAMSEHPELLPGLPTRISTSDQSNAITGQYLQLNNYYRALRTELNDPNLVILSSSNYYSDGIPLIWLMQAFDHYVVDNQDLEASLVDAQNKAISYRDCIKNIPLSFTPDLSTNLESPDYNQMYIECIKLVDPKLALRYQMGR